MYSLITVEAMTFSDWIYMIDDEVMRKIHPILRKGIGIACQHKMAIASTELVSG